MTTPLFYHAVLNCGPLLRPLNGAVDLGDGTKVGAIAKYSCNPGHAQNGSSTRQCLASGVWSGVAPSCLGKDCKCQMLLG